MIEICFGKGRKHCGKRRKCWLPAFSSFPIMFSKGFIPRVIKSWDCVVKIYKTKTEMKQKIAFLSDKEKINPFPDNPWFLHVCSKSLLKTLWEKKKLLVTSNFSFPTAFSTLLEDFMPFSPTLKLSSANSFSLKASKICRLGKG